MGGLKPEASIPGSRLLVDTHVLLWWLFGDARLSPLARACLKDPERRVLVSAASVWEIATKFRLGKLPGAAAVAADIPGWVTKARFEPLAVTLAHAAAAGRWEQAHRDPFDRMLAAQAQVEGVPLLTSDEALREFPVELIW